MAQWAFGEFVLDLDGRRLLRAGAVVALSPKALTLLGVLVEQRPGAVSKQALQDHLWPRTFVVEKNLTNLIGEIRAALGDEAGQPRFVRTVPRFGYAFVDETIRPLVRPQMRMHNLPEPLTSFIGRARETDEIRERLSTARLLTLTGAGGCGKTRLALAAGRALMDRYGDGVWMADFGPISDATLVAQAVAAALDVRERPGMSPTDAIAETCGGRRLLLVFDNCEHVIGACAALAERLLQAAPGVSILATSREAFGVSGEAVWRVPSMAQDEAIALFVARANGAEPEFGLTDGNRATVAEICERLDGIPLAIELAAARLRVLALDEIHARLNDRFRLLTGGSRTAVARQRTLEATVAWSYDLLTEPERLLLRRLSVFAGRTPLDAIEEVCHNPPLTRESIVDLLARLTDKSLVNVEGDPSTGRVYRMLETIRQFAGERLLDSPEPEALHQRHFEHFSRFAATAERELNARDQVRWLQRLDVGHDNLRAALEWGVASPARADGALELAAALSFFWLKRGYCSEGETWLGRALELASSAGALVRARALIALGSMQFFQGNFTDAKTVLRDGFVLADAAGEPALAAFGRGIGAINALELGDFKEGARLAEEGRRGGAASAAPWMQAPSLSCLAYIALQGGDAAAASALHEDALRILEAQGEKWGLAIVFYDLALLRIVQGRTAEAREFCRQSAALSHEFADRRGLGWCLGLLAGADAADGEFARAARLRGAMERVLQSVGVPIQPTYERWIDKPYFTGARRALGAAAYDAARVEGSAMSLTEAFAVAFAD